MTSQDGTVDKAGRIFQIVIKGFEKKKIAKTLFGVPRATFDPKGERLIGP